ncbi:cyclin-domain-containing protein, partial [Obelidium mucronatum]
LDTAASIIESIWPTQIPNGCVKVLPLKVFIQEILRRSKTSFSTLQLALFYIVRLRNELAKDSAQSQDGLPICGRRMFLTALILASKYLQDRNYSNKAWSKISGLSVLEINSNEFKFLSLIDYELFVGHETFANWTALLMAKTQQLQLAQQLQ